MSTAVFPNAKVTAGGAQSSSIQRIFVPDANLSSTGFLLGVSLAAVLGVATNGGVLTVKGPIGSGTPAPIDHKVAAFFGSGKLGDSRSKTDALDRGGNWVSELDWIKSQSDISMSSLADFFGVTRKALYGWFEGAEPRRPRQERIAVLRSLLATLPSREHRSAFFEIADRQLASGETVKMIFSSASKMDNDSLVDDLNNALAELDTNLEQTARRIRKGSAQSRQFESEFRAT